MLRVVWYQAAFQFISQVADPHLLQRHVTAEKPPLPVASEYQCAAPVQFSCDQVAFSQTGNVFSGVGA